MTFNHNLVGVAYLNKMEVGTTLSCTKNNTLNFTSNGEDARALFYNVFDKIIILCILPVIVAFGLGTNASFLFVVARVPRMQTMTNLYLVQLALADLLFLLLTVSENIDLLQCIPTSP